MENDNRMEQERYRQPNEGQQPGGERVIPVVKEELHIDKRVEETGRVVLQKSVLEHEERVNIPVISDEVHVERVPVNQYVAEVPPAVRYEGDTMIIPVLREVLVVEKRLEIVEEIRVTRKQVSTNEQQTVILREEQVHVDRTNHPDR